MTHKIDEISKMGNRSPRIIWLGKTLHIISHLKIVFYAIALYFQIQAMLFSQKSTFIQNLNVMLLMYGLAMTFESFRDNELVSDTERNIYKNRPKIIFMILVMLFGGGIIALCIGIFEFTQSKETDLGWGIMTFGLGIIALGRQQYDQYISILQKDMESKNS